MKCSLKGLALEPRLAVSHPQLLFGEVASHDWADQNLVLANQGSTLPLQFRIQPSPYFHCLPDHGECPTLKTTLTLFAVVPSLIHCTNDLTSGRVCSLSCCGILTLTAFAWNLLAKNDPGMLFHPAGMHTLPCHTPLCMSLNSLNKTVLV